MSEGVEDVLPFCARTKAGSFMWYSVFSFKNSVLYVRMGRVSGYIKLVKESNGLLCSSSIVYIPSRSLLRGEHPALL